MKPAGTFGACALFALIMTHDARAESSVIDLRLIPTPSTGIVEAKPGDAYERFSPPSYGTSSAHIINLPQAVTTPNACGKGFEVLNPEPGHPKCVGAR